MYYFTIMALEAGTRRVRENDSGSIGAVSANIWLVPKKITFDATSGNLIYAVGTETKLVKAGESMLDEFLELEKRDPVELLAFSRNYGVLALCDHNLPFGHPPIPDLLTQWGNRETPFKQILHANPKGVG